MENLLEMLRAGGVEVVTLALIVNLMTNLIKKPVKAYSKKSGKDINKFISLIPILLSFLLSTIYEFAVNRKAFALDRAVTLALGGASLSLAIFAVAEKFLKGKDTVSQEIVDGQAMVDQLTLLQQKLEELKRSEDGGAAQAPESAATVVLRRGDDAHDTHEEK